MVHHPVSKNAAESSMVLASDRRARDLTYFRKALSRNIADFEIDQTGISDLDSRAGFPDILPA